MKTLKRNAVIITVLVFVCAAVYLNWSYSKSEAALNQTAGEDTEQVMTLEGGDDSDAAGLYYNGAEGEADVPVDAAAANEYFDQVRLSREKARDSAVATLKSITETTNADSATVNEALEAMTAMAKRTEEEARLEGLITAKGFKDCVAYMTDNNVTVTVSAGAEGLSEAGVARIKDIILTETDYNANQMKIVEVK